MPEENENVIRLDDGANDFALEVAPKKEEKPKDPKERFLGFLFGFPQKLRSDRRYLFGSVAGVLALTLVVSLLALLGGNTEEEAQESPVSIEGERKILSSVTLENRPVDISSLEMMIKKANLLYTQGERGEALNLYESISSFSESLSNFNLGVAQAGEKSYDRALASFQKAIDAGEDRAMSAINAAMCAFLLNNQALYRYYVDLAEAYLSDSAALPLYPYLYALVQYYKGHYFEAISPLTHFQNTYYSNEVDHLLSKLHLYYNDDQNALRFLERSAKREDFLDLALLYARVGEYQNAQTYLIRQIEQDKSPAPYMALALVDTKLGNFADVAAVLDRYTGDNEQEAASIYPIKARLKEELFDVHEAQKRFWQDFSSHRLIAYKMLFYYAPYKVFDVNQALLFIKQGGVNMLLNDIEEAKDVLVKGSTISKVNLNIARALKEVLRNNTRAANELMKAVMQEYPNHAILHYNLGLSYAQMGDFDNAYRHFLRGYHLNSRDILSGIFAMISARLTFRDYGRIAESIGSELENSELEEEREFILSFLGYFQGNQGGSLEWLERLKQPKSIYLALDYVLAVQGGNKERIIRTAQRLKDQQPDDLVAALLVLLAQNYGDDVQELSLKAQQFYREPNVSLNALYYGPALARELYVHVGYNIGALRRVQQLLDDKLVSEQGEVRGIVQSLALTSIYLREFEKAFVLYNSLIDELKERDSQTLFLAGVAAIGAGHYENAIALLQLAKLEAPTNYESRYALALLQQQAKNLKAASIQFAAVGNVGFESEYFDFEIDSSEYLP